MAEPAVPRARAAGARLGLFLGLVVPSLFEVQRHGGLTGVGLYAAWGAAACATVSPRWLDRHPQSRITLLTALTVAVLVGMFAIVYPLANAGVFGGGSDSDDSLNLAVRELLHGRYPYDARTYLGNAIHELPGLIVLSIPAVLLGTSAYQNLFWLTAFVWMIRSKVGKGPALVLLWVVMAVSPAVLHAIATGGNGMTSGILPVVAFWGLSRAVSRTSRIAAAMGMGLALTTRPNFLALLPLLLAERWRTVGPRAAVSELMVVSATAAAVTVPFMVYDFHSFTPMQGLSRVTLLDERAPYASVLYGAGALTLAVVAIVRQWSFFAAAAAVQAYFVASSLLLFSLQVGHVGLNYAGYGLYFLFLAAGESWPRISAEDSPASQVDAECAAVSA